LIRLSEVILQRGKLAALLASDKFESVNERIHTDQQNIKFHILRVRRKCRWMN